MDSIRVTAKTVSDAITEASIQLETSSDNIEYTIIDEGSKGFFGIGSRKAMIEARKKFTDEDLKRAAQTGSGKADRKGSRKAAGEARKTGRSGRRSRFCRAEAAACSG